MENLEIFFDTNILREKSVHDYSTFRFGNNYSDFVDFLNSNDLADKCHINITEIVLEELKKQMCECFEEDNKKHKELVSKFRVFYNIEEPEDRDFTQELNKNITTYIEQEGINLVLIPKDRSVFNKIIERAIEKSKPFSGMSGESDKGFKDVLQWESMLYYATRIESEKFLFLTKNKNDFPKELSIEFTKATNKEIEIFYELGELQTKILEINKIKSNYLLVDASIKSLLDSGELLDIINKKIKLYYNWEIAKIEGYNNLIDQGNNNYSFDIVVYDEQNKTMYYNVDCILDEKENLIISDVIVYA